MVTECENEQKAVHVDLHEVMDKLHGIRKDMTAMVDGLSLLFAGTSTTNSICSGLEKKIDALSETVAACAKTQHSYATSAPTATVFVPAEKPKPEEKKEKDKPKKKK